MFKALFGLLWGMIKVAIGGVVVFYLILFWLRDKPKDATPPAQPAAMVSPLASAAPERALGEHRVLPGKWIYCRTKPDYEQLEKIALQKDYDAVARLILAGRCGFLTEGARVYLEGIALIHSRVPIRIEGQVDPVWTTRSALD
jgi:hypothetical protein